METIFFFLKALNAKASMFIFFNLQPCQVHLQLLSNYYSWYKYMDLWEKDT